MTKKLSQDSSFPVDIVDQRNEVTNNHHIHTLNTDCINQLLKIRPSGTIDPSTGTATFKNKRVIVRIPDFIDLSIETLPLTTIYLICSLIMHFNNTGRKEKNIVLPIKKYAELRGVKDTKELRKQLRRDLELLGRYIITYQSEKSLSRKKHCDNDFFNMNLCQGSGILRGYIIFHMSDFFYTHLASGYLMSIHPNLFKFSPKTSSFALGYRLFSHYNMNYDKKNANIISVRSLLEACFTIPTREQAYPQLSQRIITPFENAMTSLSSIGLKWHYCHSKGLPLSDNELKNFKYEFFINCCVYITISNHPLTGTKRQIKSRKSKRTKSNT